MKILIGGGAALAGLVLSTSIFVIAKPLRAGIPVQQPNQTAQILTPTVETRAITPAAPAVTIETVEREGESYSATAYCLPGKTASGRMVARGIIAADPRILPLGTRVMISAGKWSGEYLVADVGGGIKGRKIDIWVPNVNEARQIGRRNIKLTVLSRPDRRGNNRQPAVTQPIPVVENQRPRVVQ
jgi:3D (Asp-Asp-Asp) domain-containing protein